ncbi:hypothetical protein DH2020_040570 [Rehmannia glutinosa]|uniref:FAD-binding PCMH-type domain-containing protein n=1 Tax=Rehmannia glutinosa TaxID=99300 RepID=A0ABR0USK8_REHGL
MTMVGDGSWGSGIGIPDSLPRVQGHGYRIHCRNIASMTSKPVRNQSFAMINCDDISYFKKILGERGVVLEEEKLDDANTDWMRKFKGSSKLMLQPRSTQEVSQILDYCNSRRLAVVPQGGNTGLVGGSVPVFDEVLKEAAKLGEMSQLMLGACALFDTVHFMEVFLVLKHLDGLRDPLPSAKHNFYILIETTGSMESHDKEKLESFLLQSMENGLLNDGVLAQDVNQASSFWRIREGIPEALMKAGAVYKYDLSLPPEKMYNLVEEMRERLGTAANVVAYGHLGDGNLHLNISTRQYNDSILSKIEPFVYEWTSEQRGSISAEHGLGLMKANKIHYSKSAETVQLMAAIKKLLDPNGILNPYKVLPTSILSQSGVDEP